MAKVLDATGDARAEIEEMRAELARKIAAHAKDEGPMDTTLPGLILSRRTSPSECFCTTYEPELVVFAQACRGNVFMLRLCPGAIPGRMFNCMFSLHVGIHSIASVTAKRMVGDIFPIERN